MEVRFFLTGKDVLNVVNHTLRRSRTLLSLIIIVVLLFAIALLSPPFEILTNVLSTVLLLLGIFILVLVLRWWISKSTNRRLALQGEQIVTIGPEGLRHRNNQADSMIFWRVFKTITADQRGIYLITEANRAEIIPNRAFATPQDAEAFLALAQTYWANGRAQPPAGPAAASATYEHWS